MVVGELLLRRCGDAREGLDVDEGRDDRDALGREGRDRVVLQPGRVLDAVRPGRREVAQRLLPEAVSRDPGPFVVSGGDRLGEDVDRPARGEVPELPVDPVADELDPAVPRPSLGAHPGDELLGLDLVGVVADVALRAGDVATGADDLRQVVALVDPPGVGRGARVADEQRAGVAIGACLGLARRLVHRAVLVETDVAVRVDEAGDDPAGDGVPVRARRGGREGDAPVDDPQLVDHLLGGEEDPARDVQRRHGPTLPTGHGTKGVSRPARRRPAPPRRTGGAPRRRSQAAPSAPSGRHS